MQADLELLGRYVASRDNEAFRALVGRHLNLVYFSALRRTNGDAHLAEDVTQLVFIALAREAASLRAHTVLAGWLYVATRHAAAQAMRTEQRRIHREQEAFAMQESSSTPAPATDWKRLRPQLDAALDELGERDRDAVLLRFFENRPFAEIGASLQLSDDAARMRVERALEKLRVLLARRGITSTSAALAVALENQAAAMAPAALAASINTAVLASGALGAGAAGAFHSMSTTLVTIGVTSAVSLFAIGTALYQANHARQAEASLAAAQHVSEDQVRTLQARLTTAEKSLAAAQVARETKPAATTANPAAAEEPAQTKKRKAPPAVPFSERMKDPTYAAAARQQALRMIQQVHGDTLAASKLNSTDLARLKTLLVERELARQDSVDAARRAGLSQAEVNQTVSRTSQLANEALVALIGESGHAQLQRDVMASGWRSFIETSISPELRSSGGAVSTEQATQLAVGFGEYFDATWRADPTTWRGIQSFWNPQWDLDPQTGLNRYARGLLEKYAPILTPAQLQTLRESFVEQTKWMQLNQPR